MDTSNEPKPFYESKLFWLAVFQILLGAFSLLNEQYQAGVQFAFFGIMTVILRSLTNAPIIWKQE